MSRKKADRPKPARGAGAATFGRILHALRNARGWSQADLAARAGLSQPMIGYLESGAKQPGWDTVQSLADALGVAVGDFRRK